MKEGLNNRKGPEGNVYKSNDMIIERLIIQII